MNSDKGAYVHLVLSGGYFIGTDRTGMLVRGKGSLGRPGGVQLTGTRTSIGGMALGAQPDLGQLGRWDPGYDYHFQRRSRAT